MRATHYTQLQELCRQRAMPKLKGNAALQCYWQIGQILHTSQLELKLPHIRQLIYAAHLKLVRDNRIAIETTHLRQYYRFYSCFPTWQCAEAELTWSHYQRLCRLKDQSKRYFYQQEALQYQWTITVLDRQIKALYYERIRLWTPAEALVQHKTPVTLVKDHYILEFLQLPDSTSLLERELEDSLLEQLQDFLLELGNGYSFVARQKMVTTATGKHFFIDLVFYHFELKCFVLIDLKIGELSHRDIGQMDMYVRLYEEKWRGPDDNPTIGIILCSEKDQTIVKYSLLSEHSNLYASTYQLNLGRENGKDQSV